MNIATILIQLIIYFAEALIVVYYTEHIFVKRDISKYSALIWIAVYLFIYFMSYINIPLVNLTTFFVGIFIAIYVQYDVNALSVLFHSFLISAAMGLSELVVISVESEIVSSFVDKMHYDVETVIVASLSKIIFFFVIRVFVHIQNRSRVEYSISKGTLLYNFIPVLTIIMNLILLYFTLNYKFTSGEKIALSFSSISLLFINVIIFWEYGRLVKKDEEKTRLKIMLQKEHDDSEYYKLLYRQDENQRIIIHDYKNHILYIQKLYAQGDYSAADEYVNNITKDMEKSISRFSDNKLLNIIINHYYEKSLSLGIQFTVDIHKGVLNHLKPDELTSLIGNLLDNAFEGTEGAEDSFVDISISKNRVGVYTLITVVNSCIKNPIVNGRIITRKEDKVHHGIGLRSIQRILSEHVGEYEMHYDDKDNTFHIVITIRDN